MSREERITQLSKASDWRAALMILTSEYFANDARVWQHVNLERECIYFTKMLSDGTFSSGELALLRIGASLFSPGARDVQLYVDLGCLDENAARLALRAMASFCGVEQA